MKQYAEQFYKSQAWKDCRAAFAASKRGLCERCLKKGLYKAGEIVHHKTPITPDNIGDPDITLNWNNLMLVCRDCHAELHRSGSGRRYTIDDCGRVIFK